MVTDDVLPGALGGWVGTVGSGVEGPLTVRVVAAAAGVCVGLSVGLSVGLFFLPASVVGDLVSRLEVGLLLLSVSVVIVVVTEFCATVANVTLLELFDTDVVPSVPLTEQKP